jgi:hypothetical protein
LVWRNWDDLAPDSLIIWINEVLGGGERGDGFPVNIEGVSVVDMKEISNGLAVLNSTSLLIYNHNGGEVVRRSQSFSDPALETAGKYILVAETGGNRLMLETRAKTVTSITTDYEIIAAAVGDNGTVAVITGAGQSYSCAVVVYNRQGEEIYRRDRVTYATDVAVSPDGRTIAGAGVTTSGGAIEGRLDVFRVDSGTEAVYTCSGSGTLLCAAQYLNANTLLAVGDDQAWLVNWKAGTKAEWTYGGAELLSFAVSGKRTAVVTRPYGSTDGGAVTVLDSAAKIQYSYAFSGGFRCIAPVDGGFLVLTEGQVFRLGSGGCVGQTAIDYDGLLISALDREMVVLGLTSLSAYSLPTS